MREVEWSSGGIFFYNLFNLYKKYVKLQPEFLVQLMVVIRARTQQLLIHNGKKIQSGNNSIKNNTSSSSSSSTTLKDSDKKDDTKPSISKEDATPSSSAKANFSNDTLSCNPIYLVKLHWVLMECLFHGHRSSIISLGPVLCEFYEKVIRGITSGEGVESMFEEINEIAENENIKDLADDKSDRDSDAPPMRPSMICERHVDKRNKVLEDFEKSEKKENNEKSVQKEKVEEEEDLTAEWADKMVILDDSLPASTTSALMESKKKDESSEKCAESAGEKGESIEITKIDEPANIAASSSSTSPADNKNLLNLPGSTENSGEKTENTKTEGEKESENRRMSTVSKHSKLSSVDECDIYGDSDDEEAVESTERHNEETGNSRPSMALEVWNYGAKKVNVDAKKVLNNNSKQSESSGSPQHSTPQKEKKENEAKIVPKIVVLNPDSNSNNEESCPNKNIHENKNTENPASSTADLSTCVGDSTNSLVATKDKNSILSSPGEQKSKSRSADDNAERNTEKEDKSSADKESTKFAKKKFGQLSRALHIKGMVEYALANLMDVEDCTKPLSCGAAPRSTLKWLVVERHFKTTNRLSYHRKTIDYKLYERKKPYAEVIASEFGWDDHQDAELLVVYTDAKKTAYKVSCGSDMLRPEDELKLDLNWTDCYFIYKPKNKGFWNERLQRFIKVPKENGKVFSISPME